MSDPNAFWHQRLPAVLAYGGLLLHELFTGRTPDVGVGVRLVARPSAHHRVEDMQGNGDKERRREKEHGEQMQDDKREVAHLGYAAISRVIAGFTGRVVRRGA